MASVGDAIRTLLGSKVWLLKIGIMSGLIVYPVYQMVTHFEGWTSPFAYLSYAIGIFYLGYIFLISHNLINEKPVILPGFFNPFKILFAGIGAVLSVGPMICLMVYVGYCLNQILPTLGMPANACITTIAFVEMLLLGIVTVQMTLYTTKLNPLYAYNLVKILKTFLDFAFKAIPLFLILALFSAVVLYPISVLTEKMFGSDGLPLYVYFSFCGTFLLIVTVMFYSQLAMENLVLFNIHENDETAADMMDKQLLKDYDEINLQKKKKPASKSKKKKKE